MPSLTPLCTIFLLVAITSTARVSTTRITMRLIHRDLISTPTGSTSLPTLASDSESTSTHIEANLIQSSNTIYYVNFSIGTPPVPQLAVLDTGSNLMWVKCLPCEPCSPLSGKRFFDPATSSTFVPKSCDLHCKKCNDMAQCEFRLTYSSAPSAVGILATEQLTFSTSDGGTTVVPNILFGCTRKTRDLPQQSHMTGVMGLGPGPNSLLWRIGTHPKFSYCIGDAQNPLYPYNRLELGDGAIMEGYSTPLVIESGRYYVDVVRISLGGSTLEIPKSAFAKTPGVDDGVIVDTGAKMTYLHKDAYDVLEFTVRDWLRGSKWTRVYPEFARGRQICYGGKAREAAEMFPLLGIHFAGGAALYMDGLGTFLQHDRDIFCLAFLEADYGESSCIGILAQQNYNVGFDLSEKKVYFQRIDCKELDE
ncbi:unnamed protein product [Linum tenue]|uniref:Peptidase A1 domain-containing protein n=2 Tax=Linum tenue TaxID=586396 RepID=A0AAV0IAN2_9ROSI|nr:unnamed protein product [Linum tenue]